MGGTTISLVVQTRNLAGGFDSPSPHPPVQVSNAVYSTSFLSLFKTCCQRMCAPERQSVRTGESTPLGAWSRQSLFHSPLSGFWARTHVYPVALSLELEPCARPCEIKPPSPCHWRTPGFCPLTPLPLHAHSCAAVRTPTLLLSGLFVAFP